MKIVVYCSDCDEVLDRGVIDKASSLLVWNDFTSIDKHTHHNVTIKLESITNKNAIKKYVERIFKESHDTKISNPQI